MNHEYLEFVGALAAGGEEAAAQCLFQFLVSDAKAFVDVVLDCNAPPILTIDFSLKDKDGQRLLSLQVDDDTMLICDLTTAAKLSVLFSLLSSVSEAEGFTNPAVHFHNMAQAILAACKEIATPELLAHLESVKAAMKDARKVLH